MRCVHVQSMHHRRSFENDSNSRVAMTVDSSLVALRQAKPSFQIEIVSNLLKLTLADEKASEKAHHHLDYLLVNQVLLTLESIDQFFELLLPSRASFLPRFESCGYFRDVLDVASDRLLFGPNFVEAPVDTTGQATELLFREPPFFSSRFRWIDSRTSFKASAIRKPGGWSGPP